MYIFVWVVNKHDIAEGGIHVEGDYCVLVDSKCMAVVMGNRTSAAAEVVEDGVGDVVGVGVPPLLPPSVNCGMARVSVSSQPMVVHVRVSTPGADVVAGVVITHEPHVCPFAVIGSVAMPVSPQSAQSILLTPCVKQVGSVVVVVVVFACRQAFTVSV